MKNFGHIISSLRKEKGLTQAELGKRLNVSYQAVSKWENNLSQPDLDTISRMAEIFEISIADFFAMVDGKEVANTKASALSTSTHNLTSIELQKLSQIKALLDGGATKPTPRKKDPLSTFVVPKAPKSFNFKKFLYWLLGGLSAIAIALLMIVIFVVPSYNTNQIAKIYNYSAFNVTGHKTNGFNSGVGVFIDADGTAITNYSILENAESVSVFLINDKTKRFNIDKIIGYDEAKDIAIIKVDLNGKRIKPAKISTNAKIKNNELVYSIYYTNYEHYNKTCYATQILNNNYQIDNQTFYESYSTSKGIIVNKYGKLIAISNTNYSSLFTPISQINNIDRSLNLTFKEFVAQAIPFNFYDNDQIIHMVKTFEGYKINPYYPEKEGYIFSGWYTDETFTTEFDFSQPLTDKFECYAKWTPITYSIKFIDEQNEYTQSFTYDVEQTLTPNQFVKPFYNFKHWTSNEKSYQDSESIINLSNVDGEILSFEAVWEGKSYTVKFNAGFETEQTMENLDFQYNETALPILPTNTFTRTGYIFSGWKHGETILNEHAYFTPFETEESTIELTAIWKPITYQIQFVFYETDESYFQTFTYDKLEKLMPCKFTKSGYHFTHWILLGWNMNLPDEDEVKNLSAKQGTVFVCRAIFEINEYSYKIRFHSGIDGVEAIEKQYKLYESIDFNEIDFNYQGYHVSVWKDAKGNTVGRSSYADKDYNYSTFDLYPTWEENIYYTNYFANGKTDANDFVTESVAHKYFEEFTIIDCPIEVEGFLFDHWEINGSVKLYPNQVVKSLVEGHGEYRTMYAQFVPITYYIEFDANGGEGSMERMELTYNLSGYLEDINFTREGYEFVYWEMDGDSTQIFRNKGYVYNLSSTHQETVTLKAVWKQSLCGEGTEESPYLIQTLQDLDNFALFTMYQIGDYRDSDTFVSVVNDIDCTDDPSFLGIHYFNGTFDGQGHKIINLKSPLFFLNAGVVKNVKLENYYRESKFYSAEAPLIQYLTNDATVENCSVTGTMVFETIYSDNVFIGGLIGDVQQYSYGNTITIKNCMTDIKIKISDQDNLETQAVYRIGGILGQGSRSNYSTEKTIPLVIENCISNLSLDMSTTSKIKELYIGGIIGYTEEKFQTNLINCVSAVNLTVNALSDVCEINPCSFSLAEGQTMTNCYVLNNSLFVGTINGEDIVVTNTKPIADETLYLSKVWWVETMMFDENIWVVEDNKLPQLK